MTRLEKKLIERSYQLIDMPQSRFKHFTYITLRNKILNIGYNFSKRSNPISKKFNYRFDDGLHAEAHAIISFIYPRSELYKYRFYNVRITNQGKVALSAPCEFCQSLLLSHGISDIYYTNEDGVFEKFEFPV